MQLFTFIAHGLMQLCVIVEKDEIGYGLTVSGDKPVHVQSVKESKLQSWHFLFDSNIDLNSKSSEMRKMIFNFSKGVIHLGRVHFNFVISMTLFEWIEVIFTL